MAIVRTGGRVAALLLLLSAVPNYAAADDMPPEGGTKATQGTGEGATASVTPSLRIRQGTKLIKELGYFKMTGDRLTFHSQRTDLKFRGLENLALERIARTINDATSLDKPLLWEISGEFTEYRGGNYLLITHAVLRAGPEVESAATAAILPR